MKFETIKNILEDNVEVFKKSDGNYGIGRDEFKRLVDRSI
jgi:hypothetical protein